MAALPSLYILLPTCLAGRDRTRHDREYALRRQNMRYFNNLPLPRSLKELSKLISHGHTGPCIRLTGWRRDTHSIQATSAPCFQYSSARSGTCFRFRKFGAQFLLHVPTAPALDSLRSCATSYRSHLGRVDP